MRRRKRSPGKPIGGGGARNPASLANLKRGSNDAPEGNLRSVGLDARAEKLLADTSREIRELTDLLAEAAPVKDNGAAPAG